MIILTLRLFFVKMKMGNAQNLCRINQRKRISWKSFPPVMNYDPSQTVAAVLPDDFPYTIARQPHDIPCCEMQTTLHKFQK